jgi:hypothetical protein
MLSESRIHTHEIIILDEKDISWQIQNKIHHVLNSCFDGISVKFISKTYGYTRPIQRVLGFIDGELVAHLGISSDTIVSNTIEIDISCLGLWVSMRNGWAAKVMEYALKYLRDKNCQLALGITNNRIILKRVLPKFNHITLDICIKGKNHHSKESDKAILFPIHIHDNNLTKLITESTNAKTLHIKGEPF